MVGPDGEPPACLSTTISPYASNSEYNKIFSQVDEIYTLFKIKEVHRKLNALFCGAYPVVTGYDSISVDPLKSLPNHPLHIKNIETLEPAQAGEVIYLFDSKFDTSTNLGMMKGKPVGIDPELSESGYKSFYLSLLPAS